VKKKKIYEGKILGLSVYEGKIEGRKVKREIIEHMIENNLAMWIE